MERHIDISRFDYDLPDERIAKFPLAERSPQQFVNPWTCRPEEFLPCEVTLLHERGRASSVTLRVAND